MRRRCCSPRESRPWLRSLALLAALGLAAGPASGGSPVGNPVKVLLMAIDADVPLPSTLQHYENGQVTNQPWTSASTLEHFAFTRDTSFAALYDEMSYGQAQLTGDAVLLSLPYPTSSYDWWEWAELADAEAQSLGYDLSSYDRFLYLLPDNPQGALVQGRTDADRGWCTHLSTLNLRCIFHELGHTLGFREGSELQADGSIQTYGDVADGLMGWAPNSHVSPYNKDSAGWLSSPRMLTVTSSGSSSHTLSPQSSQTAALQVVKVENYGARAGVGVVDTYVSFRDTNGFDSQLLYTAFDLDNDSPVDSVLVHHGYRVSGGESLYLKSLQAGEQYWVSGVNVQVNSISPSGADVTVTHDPYYPLPPVVQVSPSSVSQQPWSKTFYTLSITNPNPPSTPFDSYYEVTFSGSAAGWSRAWNTIGPKVVAPGQTKDFDFWVDPPGNAALGVYSLDVEVAEDGTVPASTQVQTSYTVLGPMDVTPPSVPTGGSVTPGAGNAVFVSWPPSTDDLSGVAGYEVLKIESDGDVYSIGTTGWIGLVDEDFDPTDLYSVRAYDAAGNYSWWGPAFPLPPLACGLGFELVGVLPPLLWLRSRRRRR